MELYMIRHGETVWNKEERLQGRSDIELNEYGIELAEITAKAIEDVVFDRIYSSPLKRAYKTAEIIKGGRDISIITDDRLKEMCFGDYEGIVTSSLPDEFWKFFDAPAEFVPAKGGETFEEVTKRAASFVDEVIIPASKECGRMLVVAHGALMKALMVVLGGLEIKDFWSGIFPRNCCVSIYNVNGNEFELVQNGKIYYEERERKDYSRK